MFATKLTSPAARTCGTSPARGDPDKRHPRLADEQLDLHRDRFLDQPREVGCPAARRASSPAKDSGSRSSAAASPCTKTRNRAAQCRCRHRGFECGVEPPSLGDRHNDVQARHVGHRGSSARRLRRQRRSSISTIARRPVNDEPQPDSARTASSAAIVPDHPGQCAHDARLGAIDAFAVGIGPDKAGVAGLAPRAILRTARPVPRTRRSRR